MEIFTITETIVRRSIGPWCKRRWCPRGTEWFLRKVIHQVAK